MSGARAAVPVDGVHPRGGHARWPTSAGSPRRWARRPGRPACGWSPATPRSSTPGTATASTSTRPDRASSADGVDIRPSRAPARRRRPRQRRPSAARGRGDELPRGPGVRHRRSRATPRRCTGWSRRCSTPAPTSTCCATPPAAGSRRRSTRSPARPASGSSSWSGRSRPGRGRRRLRDARAGPALRRQRGQAAWRSCRPSTPTGCWRRCAAHPHGAGAAVIGTSWPEHPGMVVARTGLGGDPRGGPAGRRAAAPDLLTRTGPIPVSRVRPSSPRPRPPGAPGAPQRPAVGPRSRAGAAAVLDVVPPTRGLRRRSRCMPPELFQPP